jgi:hypothetical protein
MIYDQRVAVLAFIFRLQHAKQEGRWVLLPSPKVLDYHFQLFKVLPYTVAPKDIGKNRMECSRERERGG